MAVLLITYDLNEEKKRPPIVAEIKKKWPTWAKLSESSYAIKTQQEPKTVYDSLKHLIDNNDELYVVSLRNPYWGRAGEVNEWLKSNLPS